MTHEQTPTRESAVTPAGRVPLGKMEKRAAVSGLLGTALEFYDFAVYGALAATLFPILFFSELGEQTGLLVAFATYGVGYFARPLGAVVLGHLGDRIGRKPILFFTLALMGLASVGIGVLPTGQGMAVAVVLVAFRLLQGFALGGEASGSQALVVEHAHPSRRGILGALVFWGGPISQVLTNLSLLLLTSLLSEEQYLAWGWRIPFLLGLAIIAVAVYVRRRVEETPAFVAERKVEREGKPARWGGLGVLRTHWRAIVQLTLVWGPPNLVLQLMVVWGLSRLRLTLEFPQQTVFLMMTVALAVSVWASLLGGWLSDRFKRSRLYLASLPTLALGFGLFLTLNKDSSPVIITLIIILTLASCMFAGGIQPALFAERFPTASRFTGMALPYTLANLIFGAPAPLVATALTANGDVTPVLVIALVSLAVCAIATWTLRAPKYADELDRAVLSSSADEK